jgi:hypothetical protein
VPPHPESKTRRQGVDGLAFGFEPTLRNQSFAGVFVVVEVFSSFFVVFSSVQPRIETAKQRHNSIAVSFFIDILSKTTSVGCIVPASRGVPIPST